MSDDYDRAAELSAIRERAARESVRSGCGCVECLAKQDRRVLLARLDALEDIEAERDAIARDAEATVTALNAAVQRLGEQRDNAYALLSNVCMYLERLPSRTPERERLITAIHMQLGPSSARVDGLP